MGYTVEFKPAAKRSLEKLPTHIQATVLNAIDELQATPRPDGCKKLKGEENLWRIRVGQYRVIYQINSGELIVLVVKLGHRKDIYR